jgi:hypothetical protein
VLKLLGNGLALQQRVDVYSMHPPSQSLDSFADRKAGVARL